MTPTFAAVTAYADYLRFGALPYGGGTFEQPAELLDEMRVVHGAYAKEKDRLENRQMRRAKKKGGRR